MAADLARQLKTMSHLAVSPCILFGLFLSVLSLKAVKKEGNYEGLCKDVFSR